MGVRGLWRLLLPIGRRISIEVLEGQIIAIDASIWLTQFLKAMRDPNTGSVKPAAHLIGFFRRLAKLRFHGIRPVLVFDGPTPIIKVRELALRRQRREQFAPSADGAVLRLAKRLLIQEIKKSKQLQKESEGGMQVFGFNLPSDDRSHRELVNVKRHGSSNEVAVMKVDAQLEETSEEVARALQEQEWQLDDRPSITGGGVQVETSEEIARALQEEEWDEGKENSETTPPANDWDLPIQEDDGDDSSSTRPLKKFCNGVDPFRDQDGTLDVDYLTSLPANSRKDVIEDALRKQRLNSRKEFMPVAGQPAEYSKVQLRNFLRSTRLNKSIVKMGQQSTMLNATKGEQIASDPTRRMIFEKFDEKVKLTSSVALVQQGLQGESDCDADWDDGIFSERHKSSVLASRKVTKKKMVIVDSSDEDDTLDAHASQTIAVPCYDMQDAECPSSPVPSTDDSEGGGFLKGTPETSNDELGQKFSTNQYCSNQTVNEDNPSRPQDGEIECNRLSTAPETTVTSDGHDADGDSVDWEDGDAVPDSDDESDRGSDAVVILEECQATTQNMVDSFDNVKDGKIVTQNLAALYQAQSTAANLTNWAGRAFRRAIAQHEQDGVIKASAVGCKTTISRADRFASRPMASVPTHAVDSSVPNDEGKQSVVGAIVASDDALEHKTRLSKGGEFAAPVKGIQVGERVVDAQDNFKPAISRYQHDMENVVDLSNLGAPPSELGGESRHKTEDIVGARGVRPELTRPLNPTYTTRELLAEEEHLEAERRRHARDMETVDDEMKSEIIALIKLFGIPYIESPAEAEAQCVALEALGLVDGIVTEDSDVFVFGGKTIYRNMFDDQKFVEVYRADDAMKEMSLGREEMVAMAMLLGGDYTDGVKGVGIVNAMEIIEAFPMSPDVKEGLQEFRKWLDGFDPLDVSASSTSDMEGSTGLQKFHAGHKSARLRWICPANFPAENVLNAYLNPVVDNSSQRFSWGVPDADELVKFCTRNMGWEASETRRILDPIVKRAEGGMRQTRLDSFMRYSDNIQFADVRSKRLRSVFEGVRKDTA